MAARAAFAQTVGRPANDGGIPAEPGNAPQYNGAGPVVPAQEGDSCAARFHSFDPATGTYLSRDGQRHPGS